MKLRPRDDAFAG